ncbi:MAG: stage III sporulation protein AF [Lawsonibacter sp.]|jgi:stage III sporulation protein AF|nr:stage III sporulation protein AF [Lawsonibacter sp.]
MMGAVGRWLTAVISVSLLCAMAGALMPQGAVKQVGRLVCGLVLLAAILSPLRELDVDAGRRWLDSYLDSTGQWEAALKETVNRQMKTIIEEECAAYIVDKAAQLGLRCTLRVECRETEEGLYLPLRAEVCGPLSDSDQTLLIRLIAEDLGIPEEEITIDKEETQ